ncbi:hypothetical protein [Zymomonas mobilis]|uniref:hypothetical protein n=1 Tax=Zymomonas mobilis TaxID=542 RepID=UPI0039E74DAA
MINQNQIDEIFEILQKINKINCENDVSKKWYVKFEKISFYITIVFSTISFLFILLNRKLFFWNTNLDIIMFLSVSLLCIINYIVIISMQIYFAWEYAKNFNAGFFQRIKNNSLNDFEHISKLLLFDQDILRYVLVHYKSGWNNIENRTSAITGNIKTFGLFPGLASLSIAAASLSDKNINPYFWIPIITTALLYLVAVFISEKQNSSQGVISILEYVIDIIEKK